tara:strand:+ start:148007 stop:151411 length:3405 start_codon:yes stop_codon:yes gene_type:complete
MNNFLKIISALSIIFGVLDANAQDNRTLDTKVADILAQLPTSDLQHSDRLMEEILGLGPEGIAKFTEMLVPLGTGDDTKARYALQSLAVYSGGEQAEIGTGIVETGFLAALERASDPEVKTFLMDRLIYCGTDTSVPALSIYLQRDPLFEPALSALTAIGTSDASAAILKGLDGAGIPKQRAFVDALGELKYTKAENTIAGLTSSNDAILEQKALMALAKIAQSNSYDLLLKSAERSQYRLDASKSIIALLEYAKGMGKNGETAISSDIARAVLKNCTAEDQLHFRSAALYLLRSIEGGAFTKTLLKEAGNNNKKYVASVLQVAREGLTPSEVAQWVKVYPKMTTGNKPLLIGMLEKSEESVVFDKLLLKSLNDRDLTVRIAGIKALALQSKEKSLPVLLKTLEADNSPEEYSALEGSLLRVCGTEEGSLFLAQLPKLDDNGKEVLINVLAARNVTDSFSELLTLLGKGNEKVDNAIYNALPSIATAQDLSSLLQLLEKTEGDDRLTNTQLAISKILDRDEGKYSDDIYAAYSTSTNTSKFMPILASISSETALEIVSKNLRDGDEKAQLMAVEALARWENGQALPYLFETAKEQGHSEIGKKAFTEYLSKVADSEYPADQKLLLIRKLMPEAKDVTGKKQVLMAAQKVKTFLSLVFVSEYLDDPQLIATASNAAITIALPTPGVKDALSGEVVRQIVSKSIDNLTGPDSQYIKIDVKEFLDAMPAEKGFVPIFNGKDFTGWEGLVKDPIARSKMTAKQLAKEQEKANEQMMRDWFVSDGSIGFKGEGYNNIATIKDYGDFEMIVDWKITNGGDSGIYLRGTPQVQIWDIARVKDGAEVGSGGLYNNQKNESKPLKVADNPINEWNTFRIKMVGERVTVHLNGELVTDNVVLENYWDRSIPIFPKEAIELQAHGEDLGFRNIYVREIGPGNDQLTDAEKKEGFMSLLGGKDLDHWIGNKTDYLMENDELLVRPKQGGHGNLYTAEEYSDFVLRFDFKLSPGANNGLGIHTPLEGDAAYVGKELQILDNTAEIYSQLKPYQYHGSVYGIIAAERGALNQIGEWNSQEVVVKGDHIKITLNGKVILDGNVKEASKNGTADGEDHPGLQRNKGHIAFLGHGSELAFKNIRIKVLGNK